MRTNIELEERDGNGLATLRTRLQKLKREGKSKNTYRLEKQGRGMSFSINTPTHCTDLAYLHRISALPAGFCVVILEFIRPRRGCIDRLEHAADLGQIMLKEHCRSGN